MYVNGNLGELVSNTVGPGFGQPVEAMRAGLIDPADQFLPNLIDVPGVQTKVDVSPAQSQLVNLLVYYGLAVAIVLLLRRG